MIPSEFVSLIRYHITIWTDSLNVEPKTKTQLHGLAITYTDAYNRFTRVTTEQTSNWSNRGQLFRPC